MKKLLLVLLVVTLASFLFVGCLPTTPTEGEGEGEGEAEICPTVAVTSQVAVGGKNYIKAGSQTITVTFAVPTEPVSVFVGAGLRQPTTTVEVVMYANDDKTEYTGDFDFGHYYECGEAYIYVETCETCDYCKYPYTVDGLPPTAQVEICIDDLACEGCELSFTSIVTDPDCEDPTECEDECSGFASWSIDIYDEDPFDECCDVPCASPIASDSGVCPIDFTTGALGTPASETLYVVLTLADNVGNTTKKGATIVFNPDTCDEITLDNWPADTCVDTGDFVVCTDAIPG